jgi:flagellar basal body-associated protein FliL
VQKEEEIQMDKIISIIIVILILLATIAFYLAPFVGGLWQGAARSKVIAKILPQFTIQVQHPDD